MEGCQGQRNHHSTVRTRLEDRRAPSKGHASQQLLTESKEEETLVSLYEIEQQKVSPSLTSHHCHQQLRAEVKWTRPQKESATSMGRGLWTIDIVAILIDVFNTPLGIGDALVPPSGEVLESSQSLRGRLHQESRRNKSKRSAEISTSAASYIQALEVQVHQLQADISTPRAPEAAPAPSTSASYRKKTANLRSTTCSLCLTSGDHSAFFQANSQDLTGISQRKDTR
ncbi:hypothetical protein V8E36_005228 [Tilletia maclaganii]